MSNASTQKIIPFIWFENQAKDAATWYTSIFPDSLILSEVTLPDTPSGDVNLVTLSLMNTEFQFMSAGPMSDRNPSFSYTVACETVDEVDRIWKELSPGASALMPLGEYPFSTRYGWLKDRHGVSWQVMHDGGMTVQRITPSLLFVGDVCGRAEEALNFYASVFPDAGVIPGHLSRYGAGQEPEKEGNINYARFHISGQEFVIMESALEHKFRFNEMQSFVIRCEDQKEMDMLWNKLSAVPEAEQCGWLKDKFGISWQLVTYGMEEMMKNGTKEQLSRMMQTLLPMKKLDIAAIEHAYRGSEQSHE